jgi:tyrosine-protein phosphatase
MQLPSLRPIKTNPHGFAEVPQEMEEEDQEPNFDIPQSREEKPAAYPHGPICIYECGVYLYFEPTAEQAADFDVIVNVASEVKNPFTTPAAEIQKDIDARRIDGPPAENVDFANLPERKKASSFDTQSSSPTTPKATPVAETIEPTEHLVNGTSRKTPEYIHMLWEHNTDIVPDLYKLVKTMDERVQQGKRILVHCQCGVSRSASLIVAYGLYKNPGISVQEAYDAVKKRSKWIGPNMNLIMQLQEFRNGLLRANESRGQHSAYGFPRRSAGLPTAASTGTNMRSPFGRDMPTGQRTPRTAPLPPESDISMQRASTGNIMSRSPGPLSAPTGSLFSPGFRRSWASCQTHFDLSPKSSPKSATPYVDPKGHVVPVLSITDNDVTSSRAADRSHGNDEAFEQGTIINPLTIPNFSRQLPLRESTEIAEENAPVAPLGSKFLLLAPLHSNGVLPLRSPMKSSFDLPPMTPANPVDRAPWSRELEMDPAEPLMSPRATEFHMTPLKHGGVDDDQYGLLSPRGTGFDLTPPSIAPHDNALGNRSSQSFDVSSPISTKFPDNIFSQKNDVLDFEMTSPRAAEFHMTPLKPRVEDEDPFGLTSPTRAEYGNNPFDKFEVTPPRNCEPEARRPSFQAVLPPSHSVQPVAFNGFASLDGTARSQPSAPDPSPLPNKELHQHSSSPSRVDSLSTAEVHPQREPKAIVDGESSETRITDSPRFREQPSLLSTPRQGGIRTRFSSPNMREQRKLHKLQTEMEASLPQRAPHPPQAADDLDALMSPRAEEFTRNPFHFDLRSPTDDPSPASSNETIKEGHSFDEWKDPQPITPQKVAEDPRSPVQTGSSPIVRNIWDVL